MSVRVLSVEGKGEVDSGGAVVEILVVQNLARRKRPLQWLDKNFGERYEAALVPFGIVYFDPVHLEIDVFDS